MLLEWVVGSVVLGLAMSAISFVALDCLLRARTASSLSVFLHNGFLYAHGALDNRCHRWRLRDAR